MKHKKYDMIVKKAANTNLVVLIKSGNPDSWREEEIGEFPIWGNDYFLCLPKHKEAVLNILNGGESQVNYGGTWQPCNCGEPIEWSASWWYMSENCESRKLITEPEPKVEADEPKPGDKVYIKHTQQQCLLIGNHPEHPCYVVEMPDNEFRVVPLDMISKYPAVPTPLNIPWHLLHPKFKFATMDKDGDVDLWDIAPICFDKVDEGECWDAPFGIAHETLTDHMEIDKEGINWKQSLTERPKVFPPKEFWQQVDLLFKCDCPNCQKKGE